MGLIVNLDHRLVDANIAVRFALIYHLGIDPLKIDQLTTLYLIVRFTRSSHALLEFMT